MAINFPNSPSNGATHTAAGQTFTYDGTAGVWNPPSEASIAITSDGSTPSLASGITGAEVRTLIGAGGSGSGTTVVANATALPGSASTGDMAFVTGTNRLYLWNGTGWYNIALINNTPTISGVSSAYGLATDGTATTVTVVAADPEGLPITYSIISDTSGNIATVAQGTGASTNVWTITPSTNSAHFGTFSLTFRASDGINNASAAASFTLAFSITNSKYTSLLLTSVGANDAVNNAIDDKSSSNHTITTVGDVHQNTFSPYREGGYSTYFDGSGDYLQIANDSSLNMGTSAFTIELWMWLESFQTGGGAEHLVSLGSYTDGIYVRCTSSLFNTWIAGTYTTYSTAPPQSQWAHVAFTRDSSSDCRFFLNGTQIGSTHSNSANVAQSGVTRIGAGVHAVEAFTGYIKDVRILKGTALYTSNFTAPTENLTAITNTNLLTCHLPYIVDSSTTGHAITVNGNTKTKPFAPYDYETYNVASNSGSMYFDGTGDRLTFSHASDFSFGTGDFTIEFWMKTDSNAITGGYSRSMMVIGQLHIYMRIAAYHGGTDGAIRVYDETADNDIGNVKMFDDIWHHVAVVRESGTIKCWVDGKYNTGVSNTRSFAETSTNTIGARPDGNGHFEGNIADIRVVKGTAVYTGTSNFTPPATPLTAITNTSLLLQGTDAGIIDKSQRAEQVKLYGNTKSSTTQTKFLSSSIKVDGTGDYIIVNPKDGFDFGTGDFTIETWVYTTSRADYNVLFDSRASAVAANLIFGLTSTNGYPYYYTGTEYSAGSGSAVALNTWTHVALCRSGTTMKIFKDGTEVLSRTDSSSLDGTSTTGVYIGSAVTGIGETFGYLSDFRITKGLARYTSNFTAPTSALMG